MKHNLVSRLPGEILITSNTQNMAEMAESKDDLYNGRTYLQIIHHLFKNFPHFVLIHTVKDFGMVNEAEVDDFLKFSCFSFDAMDVDNLVQQPFLSPA